VNIENKWANEKNVFSLTNRLVDIDIEVDQLSEVIDNGKSVRNEINEMRTNFSQRIGAFFVDKLFTITKWVDNRITPTPDELDVIVGNLSSVLKDTIDNAKPITIGDPNWVTFKRKNTAVEKGGWDKVQYEQFPIHKRLVKFFFEEFGAAEFFNSNKDEINKRSELYTEKQHITNRIGELEEESKKAA
jgi:hypothetical protein